jgi:hypothetical protein
VREVKVAEVHAYRDANPTADNMMVTATGNVDVDSLATTFESRSPRPMPRTSMKLTFPEGPDYPARGT